MAPVIARATRMGRRTRSPQHPFQIRTRPYQIVPFNIAAVLPGETVKACSLNARTITDPVKNRLLGWHLEHMWFYVKLNDLDEREQFVGADSMLVNGAWSAATVDGPADVEHHYYEAGTGPGSVFHINWVAKCLKRVVDEYFRDEGTVDTDFAIGNYPAAQRRNRDWLQSSTPEASLTFGDVNVDLNADATITVGEIDQAFQTYQFLKANMGIEMGYEQWLAGFGIRTPKVELHKPELLYHVSDWEYPISAINPTDGSAASAVAWTTQYKNDTDKFVREPGFILGVQVARPKVYLSRQKGTATALMDNILTWFPSQLTNDQRASLKLIPDNDIIGDNTDANGAWVDLRDLLLYGEQFINFSLADTAAGLVALPTVALQDRYPSSTDVDGLFVAASPANQIRTDGVCVYNIATQQVDQTT